MMVRIVLNHALRKMPPLDGGLGTVKWIHIIRPCRPQSRRKNRAFGHAQQAHPRLNQPDLASSTASDQPLLAVKVELWRLSFSLLPQKGGH